MYASDIKNKKYSYTLPQELVATEPPASRGNSRLFVYYTNSDSIVLDIFQNIGKYLPKPSLLVLNKTHVIPSRITLYRQTGGKVICLLLLNEGNSAEGETMRLMVDRKVALGETLALDSKGKTPVMKILHHQKDSLFAAQLLITRNNLIRHLEQAGDVPIPLYLRKTHLGKQELKERYQTTYAERSLNSGSVAAPTAGLHFTPELLRSLKDIGAEHAYASLDVGLGTFAPLTEENIRSGTLHTEWYSIPHETVNKINSAKKHGKDIIAVGTTTVRMLESSAYLSSSEGDIRAATDIFIKPPHLFKIVDGLITNFHLPSSSLMMLVEALLQHKKAKRSLIDLYEIAIRERFRFYSFGDAMLIV